MAESLTKNLEDTDGTSLQEAIHVLSRGSRFHKIRTLKKHVLRRFHVDVESKKLKYFPSKKPCWKRNSSNDLDIHSIESVRTGWNTDVFHNVNAQFQRKKSKPIAFPELKEECCFSIVISPNHETLDLVARNEKIRNLWVRGLNHLLASCRNAEREEQINRWLKIQFKKADADGDGYLNFTECLQLLKQLNIEMDREYAMILFDKANSNCSSVNNEHALDQQEFVSFYRSLIKRPELVKLFQRYSVNEDSVMDPQELMNFLIEEQKMKDITLEDCVELIKKFEPSSGVEELSGYLTVNGLRLLLLSKNHTIFKQEHLVVHQDMNLPLCDYFIASSHNTYLMQGQLVGKSSIEGYIRALLQGCRCVELDVWDGADGVPIVYHGYTLTTKILFQDILEAIKQYAFVASKYPVILSIENHCSIQQQIKMAELLVSIFGDYLYRSPVNDDEKELPSPEALSRKILVKAKKLKAGSRSAEDENSDDSEEEPIPSARRESSNESSLSESGSPKARARVVVAKELSDLVVYCQSRKFVSFEEAQHWEFYQMPSFSESKIIELHNDSGKELVNFNMKHLSRIYPKGSRTNSSNYDPIPCWNSGCQLVALNYQTISKEMIWNQAMFSQNGKCGYVLKPKFMRKGMGYDPNFVPDSSFSKTLVIQVISGQRIPKPESVSEIIDPYVEIKVFGHPYDKQLLKTNFVNNNGFNPLWNETFSIDVKMPDLAFLSFRVKDHQSTTKDITLGKYVIHFNSMAEGYRHIHLWNHKTLQPLEQASLFVHVKIS